MQDRNDEPRLQRGRALRHNVSRWGIANASRVFRLTPPATGQTAWTETALYSFTGGSDWFKPGVGLSGDKQGALYGTTQFGGTGYGTVFRLTPPTTGQKTWTETVLYSFSGGSDGGNPVAGLIFDKEGALYSTTLQGGSSNGGTVFKLTPPAKGQTAWTETVLYSFCSLSSCSDGLRPFARLIFDKEGTLYSTTIENGSGDANRGLPSTIGEKPSFDFLGRDFEVKQDRGNAPLCFVLRVFAVPVPNPEPLRGWHGKQ